MAQLHSLWAAPRAASVPCRAAFRSSMTLTTLTDACAVVYKPSTILCRRCVALLDGHPSSLTTWALQVLLRKYVAYARRYCHPVLSPAAAVILQDFFLALRQSHQTDESTPITTRQLESMVRLAQARAKIELRETVSRADAVDVVQLMRRSLMDVAMDEIGGLDFTRSTGMSMGRQIKALVDVLNRVARQRGSPKFTRDDISSIVTEMGLQVASLTDLLETMNQQNYILKKGPGLFQLMTSVGGGE